MMKTAQTEARSKSAPQRPLVTIIIPIYKVGPFVRKCLQSVAEQTYTNIETVIVNDATPDDSMVTVNRSLEGVPNVRIINLPENGGLGNARNTGIREAAGKYIFFLDSDDWLDSTTIEKAVAKAEIGSSEVVVIDYYKANHANLTKAKDRTPYRGAKYDYFDPRDELTVLWLFNLAQIKLYQKDFLVANDFTFRDGVIYEDVDWTFKIMMTARRVSIIDEPLYYYRTARPGSILATKGDKHFDVLDQYKRVFDYIEETGKEEYLESIYAYALNAIFSVLVVAKRIPNSKRAQFFKQAQQIFRKARGDRTFKVKLYNRNRFDVILRHGNYTILSMWRSKLYQNIAASKAAVAIKKHLKRGRSKAKSLAQIAHARHPDLFDKVLGQIPRADIIFESYWGTQFSDSPKYIYEYLKAEYPDVRCVFALKNNVISDIPKKDRVRWNSYAYKVALLRAKVWVNNNNFTPDILKQDHQKFIQTFHGIPLKKIGVDIIGHTDAGSPNWAALVARCAMWDDVITAGAHHSETLRGAFQTNAQFHEVGSPRTDCLQSTSVQAKWTADVRAHFGLSNSCKIVLYAPTWRETSEQVMLTKDQINKLCDGIRGDVVVLYRHHHMAKASVPKDARILDATHYPDGQHLCAAADLLITDYSSIAFDYATSGRPAVFYTPDYEEYAEARGLYVDMQTTIPEVTFAQFDALLVACVQAINDPAFGEDLNRVIADTFLEAERPDSCQYVVDTLILPHLAATPV
jgi:CDP-glycerol glycerophosphotransferase (TagB/SpsB family)